MMMVLSDMSHLEQMENNLSFLSDFKFLNETEMAAVKKVQKIFASKNLIPCTDGSPKHIPIPDLFAVMNTKQTRLERDSYYNIVHTTPDRRAFDCIKYGKCEKACPRHLPIRKLLEDVAKEFEKAE